MILVETILGNARNEPWKERLNGATLDHLDLDQWQAKKNRFRKHTEQGTELAVSLQRNTHLQDGDVIAWDAAHRQAIVARIALQDVLIIDFAPLLERPPAAVGQTCFELGHALGNQHWPAVIKGSKVYVPLTVDRRVMASVMKTHAFTGITYEFVAGTEVVPYLAPHKARRLFGGANAIPHSHLNEFPSNQ